MLTSLLFLGLFFIPQVLRLCSLLLTCSFQSLPHNYFIVIICVVLAAATAVPVPLNLLFHSTLLLPSLGCSTFPSLSILLEVRVGGDRDSQALLLELHAKFLSSRLGHNGNCGKIVGVRGQSAFPSFGTG
jgi:hypothetical protein